MGELERTPKTLFFSDKGNKEGSKEEQGGKERGREGERDVRECRGEG